MSWEPWNDDWPQPEIGPEHFWWMQRRLCFRRKHHPRVANLTKDMSFEDFRAIENAERGGES